MDKQLRLRVILDAVDKLLKPLEGNEKASARLNKQLKAQRDRLKELQTAQRDVASRRELETSIVETTMKMAAQRRTVDQLRAAYTAADSPSKTLTRNYTNAREALARLERENDKHRAGLRAVEARLDATGSATLELARDEDRLRLEIDGATEAIKKQQRELSELASRQRRTARIRGDMDRAGARAGQMAGAGAGAMAAGAAAGAPLYAGASAAMSFEEAMADVRKVVNFPTPAAFERMNRDVLALSTRIPVAREELAGLVAQGARAGVQCQALLGYAEAAAKMGVAFEIPAEEAGHMMATWRAAFGLQHQDVIALADRVNYLTNTYGGNTAAIADMITRVGPLADVAGASSNDLAALAQVMNKVGVESEVGATGIKNLLLGMTRGTAATRAQRKAFSELGLDAEVMARRMQEDAGGAIMSVLDAVSGLSSERQLSVLGQLFGSESVAAISPLLSRLDMVRRNFREVGDAQLWAGSMDEEYAARARTTATAVQLAKNQVSALAVEFGNHLLPTITWASKAFGAAASWVRRFAEANPAAAKAVAIVLAVISGLLLAFGALAIIVSAVLMPFAMLRGSLLLASPLLKGAALAVWGLVRGVAGLTMALMTNPITWIVLAIVLAVGLLAAAIWYVWKNWSTIGPMLGRVWERVKAGVGTAFRWIVSAFMNFTPAGLMIRAFAAMWPFLQSLGVRFRTFGGQLIMGIVNGILGGIPRLIATVMRAGGRLITAFKERMGIHSPSRVFAEFGGHTMAGLALGIERARQAPLAALGNVGAAMVGAAAIGAGGPALASSGSAAPAQAGATFAGATFNITIVAGPGQSSTEIVDELMQRIRELENAGRRGGYEDDPE